jgi:hypothetical protein
VPQHPILCLPKLCSVQGRGRAVCACHGLPLCETVCDWMHHTRCCWFNKLGNTASVCLSREAFVSVGARVTVTLAVVCCWCVCYYTCVSDPNCAMWRRLGECNATRELGSCSERRHCTAPVPESSVVEAPPVLPSHPKRRQPRDHCGLLRVHHCSGVPHRRGQYLQVPIRILDSNCTSLWSSGVIGCEIARFFTCKGFAPPAPVSPRFSSALLLPPCH